MSEPLTRKRTIRMSQELYDGIDRARGGVPFERWARDVLRNAAARSARRESAGKAATNQRREDHEPVSNT